MAWPLGGDWIIKTLTSSMKYPFMDLSSKRLLKTRGLLGGKMSLWYSVHCCKSCLHSLCFPANTSWACFFYQMLYHYVLPPTIRLKASGPREQGRNLWDTSQNKPVLSTLIPGILSQRQKANTGTLIITHFLIKAHLNIFFHHHRVTFIGGRTINSTVTGAKE